MSSIDEVKSQLLGAGTPFKRIAGATALAAIGAGKRPAGELPQAFVLFARDVSADNSRPATGKVLQRQERDLVVVFYLEDLSEPLGEASADELEAAKLFVRGKLVGFVPSDMKLKITHVNGEVTEADKGYVCFEDTFSAPTYIEEV